MPSKKSTSQKPAEKKGDGDPKNGYPVSKKILKDNIATLTLLDEDHRLVEDDKVVVEGVDETFDGKHKVLTATNKTISYKLRADNVRSQVSEGLVRKVSRLPKILLFLVLTLALAAGGGVYLTSRDTGQYVPVEVVKPPKEPDQGKVLPNGGSDARAGGVFVSPSYQEIQTSVGNKIRPIEVQNRGTVPVNVDVFYIPLSGNSLVGAPEYTVTPETIAEGKKFVRPDASKFRLLPGSSKTVGATIVGGPENGKGLYGVMAFRLDDGKTPKVSEAFKSGVRLAINQRYIVGAIVLMRFAQTTRAAVEISKVTAVQEEGEFKFKARALNTGDYIVRPTGDIVVSSNSTGEIIARLPIAERQGILPGNDRDLIVGEGIKKLQPGDYTATADIAAASGAKDTARVATGFRIDENGSLPTPDAEYALQVRPGQIRPELPFSVFIQMRNTGTRNFTPQGKMTLYRYGSSKPLAVREVKMSEIGPNGVAQTSVAFPGQKEEGNYEVVAEMFTEDNIDLGQKAASVIITDGKVEGISPVNKFRDWLSAHPLSGMLLGILLLALLIAIAIAVYQLLRRRKEQQAREGNKSGKNK